MQTWGALALMTLCDLAPQVKAHMRKVVPFAWERTLFVTCAACAVLTLMHLWQPMPHTVWQGASLTPKRRAMQVTTSLHAVLCTISQGA